MFGSRVFNWLAGLGCLTAAAICVSTAAAQAAGLSVVQSSDGTLYLQQGNNAWTIVPNVISDSDLAGLTASGELDGTIPAALLVAAGAPDTSLQVARGGDGSLYIVRGGSVWALVPGQLSDADLTALTQVGEIDGVVPVQDVVPVAPTASPTAVAAVPTSSPPTVLLGNERPAILSQAVGSAPVGPQTARTLAVALAPRDPAGFAGFEQAVNDPASPSYQHYLTPDAWTGQFGPSHDAEAAVVAFLEQGGLTVLEESPNRQVIRTAGTVDQINRLFRVTLTRYTLPDEATIIAPDQDPTVPANLLPSITSVVGLTSAATFGKTRLPFAPPVQAGVKPLSPAEIQHAYHLDTLAAAGFNGAGQTVAILAITPFAQSDLDTFAAQNKLAPYQLQVVPIPASGTPQPGRIEFTLDPSAVHTTAPGANILVYELDCIGSDTPACIILMLNHVVTDNRADIMTESLGGCEPFLSQRDIFAREQIHATAAVQGITSFGGSGDGGAYCASRFSAPLMQLSMRKYPSEVTVGGTTLTTGPQGVETAWAGSGGGESMYFPKPAYQVGPGTPSDGKEGGPDVAADARAPILVVFQGSPTSVGGTSLASPLWAGVQAVVNQARGGSRRGLVLYDYYRRPQAFQQITVGSNGGYSAGPGWNFVTGLGTPNAVALAGP